MRLNFIIDSRDVEVHIPSLLPVRMNNDIIGFCTLKADRSMEIEIEDQRIDEQMAKSLSISLEGMSRRNFKGEVVRLDGKAIRVSHSIR